MDTALRDDDAEATGNNAQRSQLDDLVELGQVLVEDIPSKNIRSLGSCRLDLPVGSQARSAGKELGCDVNLRYDDEERNAQGKSNSQVLSRHPLEAGIGIHYDHGVVRACSAKGAAHIKPK